MITKLENCHEEIANKIYSVFQSAYKVEAKLIGVANFPPLLRTAIDIGNSKTDFYGFYENDCLTGVIEIVVEDNRIEINSLIVDPKYFKKGIAGKLIHYVLNTFDYSSAIVETAVVNLPAINLYKKHGFVEFKRWTPSHGIEKLAMSLQHGI